MFSYSWQDNTTTKIKLLFKNLKNITGEIHQIRSQHTLLECGAVFFGRLLADVEEN